MAEPDLRIANLINVKGKTILLTGGGTGLGYMMSKALAMHGAKVYIASRKRAVVDKAAAELNALPEVKASGGLVVPLQADLNSKANCDKLASEIEKLEGGPGKAKMEALICNSGITWGAPLETFPEEKGWKNVLNVNVVGVYYLIMACLPMLRRGAKGAEDPARVITLGSAVGTIVQASGYPLSGPGAVAISYDASKAAVAHMARSLALDLAPQHILVNNLAPGIFPSRMSSASISKSEAQMLDETLLGRLGNEADMAGIILWLCSKGSAHVVGQTVLVDGGWGINGSGMSRL